MFADSTIEAPLAGGNGYTEGGAAEVERRIWAIPFVEVHHVIGF